MSWIFRCLVFVPAFVNRMSRRPHFAATLSKRWSTSAGLDTSPGTTIASPPWSWIVFATSSRMPGRRPLRATFAPACASAMALARPMPVPAPVTIATLPANVPALIVVVLPLRSGFQLDRVPRPTGARGRPACPSPSPLIESCFAWPSPSPLIERRFAWPSPLPMEGRRCASSWRGLRIMGGHAKVGSEGGVHRIGDPVIPVGGG